MRLYALHDQDKQAREQWGAIEVTEEKARELNAQGWGVFWVLNRHGNQRKTQNLERIDWWFCELDSESKQQQLARIKSCPLRPSLVVESRRGYHLYWRAADATAANWKRVVRWGIVPALAGDPKATDPLRLLRAPGYYHNKEDPYLCCVVWESPAVYSEEQLLRAFPDQEPKRKPRESAPGEGSYWQRIANLDCRDALLRLNGSWLVNGEEFYLKEQANGNANIYRSHDDHSTGCFVDVDGRLGNVVGGASIAAWAKWYGWTWEQIREEFETIFPEVKDDEATTTGPLGGRSAVR